MPRGFKRKLAVFNTIDPAALVSPDTPTGYFTVAQWWAKEERQAFGLLCEPLGILHEEEEALRLRAERFGIGTLIVSPCPLYALLGRDVELAFPERLLAEHYPINP